MKILIFIPLFLLTFTLVTASHDVVSSNRFIINAIIRHILEMLRDLIRKGNPEKGIPILDPLEIEHAKLDSSGDIFNFEINCWRGNFTGLGEFEILEANFIQSEIAILLDINIPILTFSADYYELDGNIYNAVPIAGKGVVFIEVHDFRFWSKIYLKQSENGKSIVIDRLDEAQFSIKRIVTRIDFDNNIDGVINAMVEDLLAEYLTRFSGRIIAAYSDSIINYLNPILQDFET